MVLETGLGGRLDATNIAAPLVSVITNVSMDHEAYLGNTISAVAGEKAGIIKPGVPVVSAVKNNEGLAEVEAACREKMQNSYCTITLFAHHSQQMAFGNGTAVATSLIHRIKNCAVP